MVNCLSVLAFVLLLALVECRTSNGELSSDDGAEKWGYADVRCNAHMFYWLYYTTHPDGYENRPWIIWLQGGPGASSCGYGNFEIIGPLKPDLTPRNTTWVKQASVLFIDSPVGAGFSYVDDPSAYNTEFHQVIDDLMDVLLVFLNKTPIFQTRPLYIFGQSHGGKVAPYLSKRLLDEIQTGSITVDLVGFAMGNAWISPPDSIQHYSDFAYWMSVVDEKERNWGLWWVGKMKAEVDKGDWSEAISANWWAQRAVKYYSNGVDIYDISKYLTKSRRAKGLLDETMENLKRQKLRLVPANLTWSDTYWVTFDKLQLHYMRPSAGIVDDLLQTTDLQITIYQGQLDIICPTPGANDWVRRFKWSNLTNYMSAERKAFRNPADNQTEFFVKAYGKFKFYSVLGAGHAVPHDKGDAAYRMLDRILNNSDQ